MSTSSEPTNRPRSLPAWLSIAMILLALAVALGGGWWLMNRPDFKQSIIVDGSPEAAQRNRQPRQQPPPPAPVMVVRDGGIRADAGAIELYIGPPQNPSTRPTTRPWTRYVILRMEEDDAARALKGQEAELYDLLDRVRNSNRSAEALKLSSEQKQSLERLRMNAPMPVSPEERDRLLKLADAWKDAAADARPKAQEALLAEMRTLGKKHEDAAMQAFKTQVEKISTIISSEQLAAYRKARADRRAASTKPVA